ncbi:MAG: hypothetical protein EOP37_28115, partial [Rubrivivax sp.]
MRCSSLSKRDNSTNGTSNPRAAGASDRGSAGQGAGGPGAVRGRHRRRRRAGLGSSDRRGHARHRRPPRPRHRA